MSIRCEDIASHPQFRRLSSLHGIAVEALLLTILVEEKKALMKKLGKRQMLISLQEMMAAIPPELDEWHLELEDEGNTLRYIFDAQAERTGIPSLLRKLGDLHIGFKDLETSKSSLEDIFVGLVAPGPVAHQRVEAAA